LFLCTLSLCVFIENPKYLGLFSVSEAERAYSYLHSDLGGIPQKEGMVGRFDNYYQRNKMRKSG